MRTASLLIVLIAALSGCTVRGFDTKLTPQLMENGELVYMYADLANAFIKENDPEAEKSRLKDLSDWMDDAQLCPKGYDVVKRQAIGVRYNSQGRRIYYFIKCK